MLPTDDPEHPSGTRGRRTSSASTATDDDAVRVWLVHRTYSDDEQNLIILTYATPDGTREYRKERALTSFTGDDRPTRASIEADPTDLARVTDPERRAWFSAEAARMAREHDPDDVV